MGLSIVTKRWFITGTDTDVGKTVASCALLQAATAQGYRTAGYKPVASGSQMTADGLRNSDALALQANSSQRLGYSQVNPFTFLEATSPHIASESEGRAIPLTALSQGLRQLEPSADWILIEGAGGWFTPLSPQATFADWVTTGTIAGHYGGWGETGVYQPCVAHGTGDSARRADTGRLGCQ